MSPTGVFFFAQQQAFARPIGPSINQLAKQTINRSSVPINQSIPLFPFAATA
jgi:hypothetical protein